MSSAMSSNGGPKEAFGLWPLAIFAATGKTRSDCREVANLRQYWRDYPGNSRAIDYANTSAGDHLVLADRSPGRLLRAARGLSAQLLASGYNLQIRIGAHSGIGTQSRFGRRANPEISDIVVVAARIEPLAKPGDILLSQQFVDDAQRYGYRFEEEGFSLLDDQYVGAQRYQAGAGVLISKDSETAQHIPIYLFGSAGDVKSSSSLYDNCSAGRASGVAVLKQNKSRGEGFQIARTAINSPERGVQMRGRSRRRPVGFQMPPRMVPTYNVFIGSPQGLEEERTCFHNRLDLFSRVDTDGDVRFHPVSWEHTVGGADVLSRGSMNTLLDVNTPCLFGMIDGSPPWRR